jgi:ubiquinone/menaquinone biosynthesis C-methylase UbiE
MESKEWDRIAKDYFNNLGSPFEKGVINPLFGMVKRINGREKMSAVDLGTGVGNLLPFLEKNFESVTGIDFSEKMLEQAEKKAKKSELVQKDMRKLGGLYEKFDIAFSINSMLLPSANDIDKMMKEASRVLKKSGKLFAVFPAIEAVLYKAMLTYNYESKKDEKKARKKTHKLIESEKYDFLLGLMNEDGEQKHFYKFEIEYRLKKAGFKNIRFSKVEYPWKIWGEKYYLKFKNNPMMWDWLVEAEK